MKKLKKRRGKRASNTDHHHHGHSHKGVECNSQYRHHNADYDEKAEARRDKLLSEEIGCFIFLISKDEEEKGIDYHEHGGNAYHILATENNKQIEMIEQRLKTLEKPNDSNSEVKTETVV